MLHHLLRAEKPVLIGSALAVAALAGWSSFAYATLSSRQQISTVTAERDAASASYRQLAESAGKLNEIETKLSAARVEYGRTVQGWNETRGRLGAAQQELAALTKRLDQARDRVAQTGSIRPDLAKPPARKP